MKITVVLGHTSGTRAIPNPLSPSQMPSVQFHQCAYTGTVTLQGDGSSAVRHTLDYGQSFVLQPDGGGNPVVINPAWIMAVEIH